MSFEFILRDANNVRLSEFEGYQLRGFTMIYDKRGETAIFVRKKRGGHRVPCVVKR